MEKKTFKIFRELKINIGEKEIWIDTKEIYNIVFIIMLIVVAYYFGQYTSNQYHELITECLAKTRVIPFA